MDRQALIARVADAQNHDAHANQDIVTICGCGMTDAQIEAHLRWAESKIAAWKPRRKR